MASRTRTHDQDHHTERHKHRHTQKITNTQKDMYMQACTNTFTKRHPNTNTVNTYTLIASLQRNPVTWVCLDSDF